MARRKPFTTDPPGWRWEELLERGLMLGFWVALFGGLALFFYLRPPEPPSKPATRKTSLEIDERRLTLEQRRFLEGKPPPPKPKDPLDELSRPR